MRRSSRRVSKGKGKKRSNSASTPSDDNPFADQVPRANKKPRISSPERVQHAALAKITAGSSSTGLAGFAALVSNAKLSAARTETMQGMRSGGSSTKSRDAQSKAGKTV